MKKKKVRFAQIYSTKDLPEDFQLKANPYKDENEAERLREFGVIFYRDEDSSRCAFREVLNGATVEGFYFQFCYLLGTQNWGKIDRWQVGGAKGIQKVRIKWMDDSGVNRVML